MYCLNQDGLILGFGKFIVGFVSGFFPKIIYNG